MARKVTFSAAAAMVVVGVAALVALTLSSSGSGVAFAAVLEHLHGSAYTCALRTEIEDTVSADTKVLVLPPGRMRFDARGGTGEMSVIVDVLSSKRLFLFHSQKAAIAGTPDSIAEPEDERGLAFLVEPIGQCWRLRDGGQEELGKKAVEGQPAEGFRVRRDVGRMQYEITIWAHERTGMPIEVSLVFALPDQPDRVLIATMHHFELRDDLDEALFSLEPPAGYTLAWRRGLDDVVEGSPSSSQGERIATLLTLWAEGQEDEAIEILSAIDWTQPIEFADKPYLFALTESAYISLKPADQQAASSEFLQTASLVRQIAKKTVSLAHESRKAGHHDEAVAYLESGWHLGALLNREPDALVIGRLVGIAVQKLTLGELITIHEATGDEAKLQDAQARLKAAEEQGAAIKQQAIGQ